MGDVFQIYIDRLKTGGTWTLQGPLAPSFLEIQEPELQFPSPIEIEGEAYLSEEHLVLRLSGKVKFKIPCSICNQMIESAIEIQDFYHTEPLEEIPRSLFNCKEKIREAFLIELPSYLECNQGNCRERATLLPYMKQAKKGKTDTYLPFSNL